MAGSGAGFGAVVRGGRAAACCGGGVIRLAIQYTGSATARNPSAIAPARDADESLRRQTAAASPSRVPKCAGNGVLPGVADAAPLLAFRPAAKRVEDEAHLRRPGDAIATTRA